MILLRPRIPMQQTERVFCMVGKAIERIREIS